MIFIDLPIDKMSCICSLKKIGIEISTFGADILSLKTPRKLSSNSVRLIVRKMKLLSHYSLDDLNSST